MAQIKEIFGNIVSERIMNKTIGNMKRLFFSSFFLVFILLSKGQQNTVVARVKPIYTPLKSTQNKDTLKIRIFRNDTSKSKIVTTGFGYDIYRNNALYIHQPNIPALSGNKGFSTAGNAQKTANLVIHKIKNSILPPSVSIEELDSLGVFK